MRIFIGSKLLRAIATFSEDYLIPHGYVKT